MRSAISDDTVSLKVTLAVVRVALGSIKGVYHDVVKFGAAVAAVSSTHVAKMDDFLGRGVPGRS